MGDNFDALWSGLKDRVREARTKREATFTMGGPNMGAANGGGRISVDDGEVDGTMIHVGGRGWNGYVICNANDLRTLAVHCLAAAEEVDEASNPTGK